MGIRLQFIKITLDIGDNVATININNQDDKDYILEHIEVSEKLTLINTQANSLLHQYENILSQYNEKIALRDNIGDRIRAGLVRQNSAAAAALEVQITNFAIELPESGVMIIHTNDEAKAYRTQR